MHAIVAALLAAAVKARPKVGVAYTRNGIGANRTAAHLRRELRNVVLSAWSVRRRETLPLALFTDVDAAAVHAATRALLGSTEKLFDVVLPDGLASFEPRDARERALLFADGGADVVARRRAKLRSRLGRLLNLARKPWDLTLFVDDDTFFCGGARPAPGKRTPLSALLHRLARSKAYDVRAGVERRECFFARMSPEDAKPSDLVALGRSAPTSSPAATTRPRRATRRRSASGAARSTSISRPCSRPAAPRRRARRRAPAAAPRAARSRSAAARGRGPSPGTGPTRTSRTGLCGNQPLVWDVPTKL